MRDLKDRILDDMGGPLTKGDWIYLALLALLALFMAAMVPVWMLLDWLLAVVHWLGLPI